MIEKNYGHIVALSSIAGLVGIPYGTVYCSTKFAVKGNIHLIFNDYKNIFIIKERIFNLMVYERIMEGVMEAVSEELRVLSNGKSNIKFTTVYPNFVLTGLAKNIKIR